MPKVVGRETLGARIEIVGEPPAVATVMPRSPGTPIFSGEVGETLASSEMHTASADDPFVVVRLDNLRDRIADRLDVALEWVQVESPENDPLAESNWREVAIEIVSRYLQHLRTTAFSPRIQLPRYWKPGNQNIALILPHSQSWFEKDPWRPLSMFNGLNTASSAGILLSPESGRVEWTKFERSMASGRESPLHLSLLVDAESALMDLRLRDSILSTGSALEVCANVLVETQSVLSKTAIKAIVQPGGGRSFGTRYFDELPRALCDRSFRDEEPELFDDLNSVYSQRNKLMHTGKVGADLEGLSEIERYVLAYTWMNSAHWAVEWMDMLAANVAG